MILTVEEMAKNVSKVYYGSSDWEKFEGSQWYYRASQAVSQLASRYGLSLNTTANVVAALSPRCPWQSNLRDAENVIKFKQEAVVTTYHNNLRIACQVLSGMVFRLNGPKTSAFAELLENPDADVVCIDTHAISIALGYKATDERINQYGKGYGNDRVRQAYRIVSCEVGVKPSTVQAICWVSWRDRIKGLGGRKIEAVV